MEWLLLAVLDGYYKDVGREIFLLRLWKMEMEYLSTNWIDFPCWKEKEIERFAMDERVNTEIYKSSFKLL